jgi:type IV secretion system protein VirB11
MMRDEFSQAAAEKQKKQRELANFLDDITDIRPYLDDPEITDIATSASGEIIIERFGKGKEFTDKFIPPTRIRGIILSAAILHGIEINTVNGFPKLETTIPYPYDIRFEGILPPWVKHPQIFLRRPAGQIFSLENYVETGKLSESQYQTICDAIEKRKNILIGGATGSGKTTMTNAVIKKMEEYTPNDRFYIVEDTPELQCAARDKTILEVKPNEAMEAVITALRCKPNRIIFGELRYGQVAYELLKSWNTGHTGNVTTIHADTCETMLRRVEELLHEAVQGSVENLLTAVHLCIHLSQGKNGKPFVDEVTEPHNKPQKSSSK